MRPLGEVLTFLQQLWAVAHGLESISKRMRATVGITGPQRLVIRLIGCHGRTTSGNLAEILHVHPSSLTGVLRRLERAHLILRVPDPNDGRRMILSLTARGQALNDQHLGTVESSVRRTLRRLSPDDIATVRDVLGALARELGDETVPGRRVGSVKRLRPASRPGHGRR